MANKARRYEKIITTSSEKNDEKPPKGKPENSERAKWYPLITRCGMEGNIIGFAYMHGKNLKFMDIGSWGTEIQKKPPKRRRGENRWAKWLRLCAEEGEMVDA